MADFAFPESAAGAVLSTVKAPVTNQFVTFNCGDRAFGVDIMSVREIRRWPPSPPMRAVLAVFRRAILTP